MSNKGVNLIEVRYRKSNREIVKNLIEFSTRVQSGCSPISSLTETIVAILKNINLFNESFNAIDEWGYYSDEDDNGNPMPNPASPNYSKFLCYIDEAYNGTRVLEKGCYNNIFDYLFESANSETSYAYSYMRHYGGWVLVVDFDENKQIFDISFVYYTENVKEGELLLVPINKYVETTEDFNESFIKICSKFSDIIKSPEFKIYDFNLYSSHTGSYSKFYQFDFDENSKCSFIKMEKNKKYFYK